MRSSQHQITYAIHGGREEWSAELRTAIRESELRMAETIYQLQVRTSDQSLALMKLIFFVYSVVGILSLAGLAFALTRN